MQFLPTTWAACCQGDVWDDHDAIMGAATYLASNGAPDDMANAVWRYNPNAVYLEMVTRYASVMAADERAYLGYHAWEVFYGSAAGDVRLHVRVDERSAGFLALGLAGAAWQTPPHEVGDGSATLAVVEVAFDDEADAFRNINTAAELAAAAPPQDGAAAPD